MILSSLNGIDIEMREGKEKDNRFSILNLIGEEAVNCKKKLDEFEMIYQIECVYKKDYSKDLKIFGNSYFQVFVSKDKEGTHVKIEPKFNSILFSSDLEIPDLEYFYPRKEKEFAKHWVVIGFKGLTPPFIEGRNLYNPKRINFPIKLHSHNLPIIGALDVNGKPIKEENAGDVEEYMSLRKSYDDGNYRAVLNSANKILMDYPQTLFKPEVVLYQIRALFKLGAYQQIINISKEFLRNYSGDDGIPEVLLYSAYVHSKLGFLAYAKYYFERLFEEHKDSEYRNMGYIYYGDDRLYQGKRSDGVKYYKEALYNTKDKLIATKAAYRLGNVFVQDLKPDEAEFYLSKVVDGNPAYFLNAIEPNYKLAKELADLKKYKVASDIMKILLKDKKFTDLDDYEVMLKDLALWLDESNQVDEAYAEYTRYLNTYDYGLFDKEVRTNRDELLFLREETNISKKFANYNMLLDKYGLESEIGKEAIYEKAKLFHDTNEFAMALQLDKDLEVAKADFPDSERVIKSSAVQEAVRELNRENCENSINLIDKYGVNLPYSEDLKLYDCSIRAGKYQLAENISKRNIEISQNTLDWTYKFSQVLFKSGRYEEFIKASDEVISLMDLDKSDKYLDIYYDRFTSFDILRKDESVIKTVEKLEQSFGETYRNLQPFKSVVSIGKARKDDLLIEKYARRVIKIQKRLNSFVETPEIELLLTTSLKHQNKLEDAVSVLKELLAHKLDGDVKARAYYELGSSYQSLGKVDLAKDSFQKSFEASPKNSWGKLSRDFLEILK
jgi:tetratricopeptide (TPR) repeat protein